MSNSKKPLGEWTLAEVKAECKKHDTGCNSCTFYSTVGHCRISQNDDFSDCPEAWDLSEPPRWTEQDKDDGRMIRCVLPWTKSVSRDGGGALFAAGGLNLNRGLLPSVGPGETATLDEILGRADDAE